MGKVTHRKLSSRLSNVNSNDLFHVTVGAKVPLKEVPRDVAHKFCVAIFLLSKTGTCHLKKKIKQLFERETYCSFSHFVKLNASKSSEMLLED